MFNYRESFRLTIEDEACPMPPYFCTQTQVSQGLFKKRKDFENNRFGGWND